MRGSQYGLFILVDYPLTSNLEVRETYYYIYQNTYILRKIGAWVFFCRFNSHVFGQENWFQNWSTEDFSVNNHWTPTISIAHNILHKARNILFQINGHKCTSPSEVTGLGSWVEGPKIPQNGPKYSKIIAYQHLSIISSPKTAQTQTMMLFVGEMRMVINEIL